MEKLKLYDMPINCKRDLYNENVLNKIKDKKNKYEKSYDTYFFEKWISKTYTNTDGIDDSIHNILFQFVTNTAVILKESCIKYDENRFKDNLASYIYHHTKDEL